LSAAGISGLAGRVVFIAKAHGSTSRILIIDNHDDFGGHAKRNEFRVGGPAAARLRRNRIVCNRPRALFSKTVNRLIQTLGVDINRWDTAFEGQVVRVARPYQGCVISTARRSAWIGWSSAVRS